jgi:hypothetical protein
MTDSILSILSEPRLAALRPTLISRLAEIGDSVSAQNFLSIFDEAMKTLLNQTLRSAGASEGSIWLVNPEIHSLTIAYNSGPNSAILNGKFHQPLSSGLISMVFANEMSFLENEVFKNTRHDKTLDKTLQVTTLAMIAVPLYFLSNCRGIVSCVLLGGSDASLNTNRGFDQDGYNTLKNTASLIGKLIDLWALKRTVGLD